jgi:hypothetical protein
LKDPPGLQQNAAPSLEEGMMNGAFIMVWSVVGALMLGIVLFEVGPTLRYRWQVRRRLRQLTRA